MRQQASSISGIFSVLTLLALTACSFQSLDFISSSTTNKGNGEETGGMDREKHALAETSLFSKDLVGNVELEETRLSRTLVVKATAYNALESQTDSTPSICAWGDRIRPGIIAVSRDLEDLGLTRGKRVFVQGIGNVIVLDRMHKRKKNQIDIFMESYQDAVNFGVRELVISWKMDLGSKVQGGESSCGFTSCS